MKLSKELAESVAKYLTEKGVASKRISTAGFGSELPAAPNNTREGRAANRRVEIMIIN